MKRYVCVILYSSIVIGSILRIRVSLFSTSNNRLPHPPHIVLILLSHEKVSTCWMIMNFSVSITNRMNSALLKKLYSADR